MSRDGEGLPNAAETRLEWNKVIYQGILRSKLLEIEFMYIKYDPTMISQGNFQLLQENFTWKDPSEVVN